MKNHLILALVIVVGFIQSANAQSSFGRTPGQFGVSQTGSAQYSIPIWVPPGPRGMQPNLALVYDSHSGISTLGIGWSLVGLGAITRCNLTYAQDTTPAPVALVTTDGYCLNGNRLRLTSGTYGTAGSTYQTEIANFSNVTANGTAGNGPAYFTVQGRDGLTYEYGYTDSNGNGAGSQVLALPTSTASAWLLSKVLDRAGNNYVINYTTLTGAAVPTTILWTPISAGSATYAYTMTFNYTANAPQSSLSKYIGGTAVSNAKLLSSIAISYSGTVLKDYFLTYQASPTTARNELISIQECADSAKSNCLLATSVTYQNGGIGVSTTGQSVLTSSAGPGFARYDLNGDGIPDLIYGVGSTLYVKFGSTSGTYGTAVALPAGVQLFGNLTGGPEDGLLAQVSGVWWYYSWNGSSFAGTSTGLAVDTATQVQLADVNGDGLPDLVGLYVKTVIKNGISHTTTSVQYYLNTSTGSTPSFNPTLAGATVIPNASMLLTPDSQYGELRRYDFNGDGRDDLVIEYGVPGNPATIYTEALISTGTGFTTEILASISGSIFQPGYFGNWNDDACTDFVSSGTLYISACNGTTGATLSVGNVVGAMDWDGDGRTDLIVANGSTLGVYLSTGSGLSSLIPTTIPYNSSCQYITTNANGDGLDDLGCWSWTSPSPLTLYLHNGAGQPADLLSSIKDGYGNSASPTYVSIAQSDYAQYSDAVFPYQNYIGPMYVVSEAVFSDPSNMPSGTYNQQFYYYGAWTNLQGRGFMGIEQVQKYDSRSTVWENFFNDVKFPYVGIIDAHYLSQDQARTKYIKTNWINRTYTLLDSTPNNQRYFAYINDSFDQLFEVGGPEDAVRVGTIETTYAFDNSGNATNVSTALTDYDPNSPYLNDVWTSTVVSTIAPNTSTWCLNLPTEVDTTNTPPASLGAPAITRHVTYVSPDYTNCRQTQQVVEQGNPTYQVTTQYTYGDSFGNLTGQTVTGIGMAARSSSVVYGTTGQFPTSITNALNQVTQTNYDPNTGKVLSVKDPNGIQTSWLYDPFERKSKETRPDGTSTTWSYNNCATAGCVNSNNQMTVTKTIVNVGGTTQTVTNTYLDSVDRTLVTSSTMLNGAFDRNEVQYNSLGLVAQRGAPCTFVSCTNYWTTFSYDLWNRVTQSQRPISATNGNLQTTTYGYQGRTTTVTDPYGKVTTKITKVTGSLARSKDNNGYYVNFNHDAFGSVLSVTDSLSNTLRTQVYAYGIKPFRTSFSDMDLGSRSFTVDALGEITAYSDGKGQNFSAVYDALSRPTSRTEPDLTTTWTWGTTATSFNIGKLASVSSVASAGTHTDSYTYDSAGRMLDHTIVNPGDGSRSFDYTYDSTTGLLSILLYPLCPHYRFEAEYAYQNGILEHIYSPQMLAYVWIADSMNARGQITKEETRDESDHPKIVSMRTYDADTGWLVSTQSGPGGGSALQNEAYLYDEMGNVTQRQNNNLGLTENFYYDNLYRLDHSTLGGSTNLQMGYDAMGDITSRSDVAGGATWTYDPVRKHAVTQAGSSAYTYAYDANGNVNSRNGSAISWTSYNYPSGVGTSTESATFDYGPDRQRWRMVYTGSAGVETTYYVTPLLDVVHTSSGTDCRNYVYAGGRPVMQLSRTSAYGAIQKSLLVDQQNSISTIVTDSSGAALVNESFTAFGNRREASTWTGTPTSTELTSMNSITRQGYTFQTVLGSMGLNHMNGRVEDAVTGRFLSPDPHVYERSNTQSYNRYSYVNNNPLSATDPTGFSRIVPCVDNCNVPAGFGNLPPRLQQLLFAGQTNYVSDHPNSFNTGVGSLFGISSNDFTGASGLPGADNADLATGFQPDPTEVTIASSSHAPSSGSDNGTTENSGCNSPYVCLPAIGEAASVVAPTADVVNEMVQDNPLVPSNVKSGVELANSLVQGAATGNDMNHALEGNPGAIVQTAITGVEFAVMTVAPKTGGPIAIINTAIQGFQILNSYFTFAASAGRAAVNALVEDYVNMTY
jgi:RHS repeat-associated protein